MSASAAPLTGNVLVVDDTPANLNLLFSMLTDQGYKVRAAINGAMALKAVFAALPELILLDINMPEMNGYEVCRLLKADERTRDIPIIFISASDEIEDKVKAFQVGGVDYVNKPFQLEEVLARVESQLTLYRQRRELETMRQREITYFKELNEMKDRFVRTVSHDLKNPISVIRGYADLLLMDMEKHKPATVREYLERIKRGSDKMMALVSDLLDLARIESGMGLALAPVPLHSFLRAILDDFELLAKQKNIVLSFTPAHDDVMMLVDADRLAQVVSNLLSNALKYTPEGQRVELVAAVEDGRAHIRVIDTGLGIPEEDLPHLFEKFYRVNRDEHQVPEGTGLGLAIARAIVEQHEGDIWVESKLGEGSVFGIVLPVLNSMN